MNLLVPEDTLADTRVGCSKFMEAHSVCAAKRGCMITQTSLAAQEESTATLR